MAIIKNAVSSELVLVVVDGTTASGANRYKNHYLKNLKPMALDQDVFDTGTALLTLQTKPTYAVQRRDLYTLAQDA
ncbi:MAG: DUF1659 domain-containing protein [Syntrophomonadaceae bacterium]|nr:DUF1659 domain-containing protein [Syntrophomonadaceae bacterium]